MATELKEISSSIADKLYRLCGQQVAITFDDDNRQYFCLCLGMLQDRFFLTQIPSDSEIQDELARGKSAVARFVESGMLCSFKTRIRKVLTDPFHLIFFDYPDSLNVTNLRSSKRVAVFLPAVIEWAGEEYGGAIRDLSEGGCLFIMNTCQDEEHSGVNKAFKSIETGSTFPIKFQMHGEKEPTELGCKVARLEEDQEELRMGIAFQKSSERITSKIGNYVSHMSKILEGKKSD